MHANIRHHLQESVHNLDSITAKYAPLFLGAILAVTTYQKWQLTFHTDGGGDLLGADIPKSLMLISGQNPYTSNPWASPYPPLLLVVVGGIIRLTAGPIVLSPDTIGLISRNIRLVGLLADASVALILYLTLRSRGFTGLSSLVPPALFLTLPSISLSPYYWFNTDVFGYPILALAVLAFVKNRYLSGSLLLCTSVIFKVHPILSIPLVLVWLAQKQGLSRSLPAIFSSGLILSVGLVAPVLLPGYLGSFLGFNLSSGFGGGTSSFTMMNLLYATLPSVVNTSLPLAIENQIWLAISVVLFVFALGVVWRRGQSLSLVDVVTIGLLVWLIPLRQIYTHYLVWAIVPFLMRGRLSQTLIVGGLLELANTMSSWSWDLSPDPFPALATPAGFLATSFVYLSVSATALLFTLRTPSISTRTAIRAGYNPSLLQADPIVVVGSN